MQKFFYTACIILISFIQIVKAQNVNFLNANFKAALVNNPAINGNGDGEIQVTEAQAYTGSINVDFLGIDDLTGIEVFTALTHLSCSGNALPVLDVSQNTALTFLDCSINHLIELDVSQNANLTHLYCQGNYLTSLGLLANTNLTDLSCAGNDLSELNLSNNINLTYLYCTGCHLPDLILTANTALQTLLCYYNNLTSLDVSANTSLTWLDCSHNPLTSLTTGSISLQTLGCGFTQLSALDISANASLQSLNCAYSQFQILDVSHNIALTSLACDANQLTDLSVGGLPLLNDLSCSLNQLDNLDVSNNYNLTYLSCGDNPLQNLILSNNTALSALSCPNDQLSGLDVRINTSLYFLDCSGNQLSDIDLLNNTALNHLACNNNQLVSLNLSANTALTYLHCSNNQLSSLNLKNGNNVNLNFFQCFFNLPLTCIQVDDPAYMDQRFGADKQSTASYSSNCGGCPAYTASFGIASGSSSGICAGGSTNLTLSIANASASVAYFDVNYTDGLNHITSRYFVSGPNTTITIPVTLSSTTTYTLENVFDANGCQAIIADTFALVSVVAPPTITSNPASTTNLCPGTAVTLTSSFADNYLWSTNATTNAINVTTAGSYTVSTSSNAGCTGTSTPVVVSYKPCGTLTYIHAADVSATRVRLNYTAVNCAVAYQLRYRVSGTSTWTTVSVTTNPYILTGLTPGTTYEGQMRTVCSTAPAIYSAWTKTVTHTTVTSFTGVSSKSSDDVLATKIMLEASVFPNPTSGNATVNISGTNKPVTIIVADISGKILKQYNNISAAQLQLHINDLAAGIYAITVIDGQNTKTLKLIKE